MSPRGCIYCGFPTARVRDGRRVLRLLTCVAHTDLPALDPCYGLAETVAGDVYPALSLADRAPSAAQRETSEPPREVVG